MTEKELISLIQKLQSELVRLVERHGNFLNHDVLELSRKIDVYVVEVQKLRLI